VRGLSWGQNHDTDERSGLRNGHQTHLLANGYVTVDRGGFDRERAIFPETVLIFIHGTQSKE
jgi:type I restriction enzyme, R subunit